MNKTEKALAIIAILRKTTQGMKLPMSEDLAQKFGHNPFIILISCLLSLRSRDVMTYKVCMSLFKKAITPEQLIEMPLPELEKEIRPIGFYKRKARILKDVSQELLSRFNGQVPATYQELRSIKGIGPKTANLVLGIAFNIPAICVDIHVHRISNRLGLVHTKRPEDTEKDLKKILPQEYWIEWNKLLVMWGQNICVPIAPFCSECTIFDLCERNGVKRMR